MIDFGEASLRLQLVMSFGPTRLLIVVLLPMDKGGFVAPFEELSHGLPVRSSQHIFLHRGVGGPDGAGPECAITVAE